MKKTIIALFCLVALSACKDKKTERINALKKEIVALNEEVRNGDKEALQRLAKVYQEAAAEAEADTSKAKLMAQSGHVLVRLNESEKALKVFNEVAEKYPQSIYAAEALFYSGFIYEDTYKDTAKALTAYHSFLKKYPQHVMAESVKQNIFLLEYAQKQQP